jgi:hypothetical protein
VRCFDSAGPPSLGEDNLDIIQRARKANSARCCYDELKQQHQVDLNDAKQLADLEDPGLQAHMDRARKQLASHELALAALPSSSVLQTGNAAVRRALSNLMVSLKNQQMAIQVACDNVLLHATNAQKIADGGQPHGYPATDGGPLPTHVAKTINYLGQQVVSVGNDLTQAVKGLEEFERELTLARRQYENTVDGLVRRGQYFEDAYAEIESLVGGHGL